ncbi:MAG: hypothetical protein ACLT98_06570 [Eggerthellaceae bacterium]
MAEGVELKATRRSCRASRAAECATRHDPRAADCFRRRKVTLEVAQRPGSIDATDISTVVNGIAKRDAVMFHLAFRVR